MPAELAAFGEQQTRQRLFPSFSAYVCDLVRADWERQTAADVALLEKATEKVKQGEPGEAFWREFYEDVRSRRRPEGR